MTGQRFATVWDAIEPTGAASETMRLRSDMMIAITNHIQGAGLTQAAAARLFGVSQARISDLMSGKISLFSLDSLVEMLATAGLHVTIEIGQTSPRAA